MGPARRILIQFKNILVKILSERLDKIFKSPTPKIKLVSYFVGCYPTPEISLELIKQAIDNGASIQVDVDENTKNVTTISASDPGGTTIRYNLQNGYGLKRMQII